jgi:Zn-finger nucleic acid-binding protein
MRRVQIGATSLLECERCDAVWMEAAAFERLCADREAQAAVLHRFERREPAPTGRVRYRKCLRCHKIMNRVNFGRMSGTVVDVCRGHGTFLDAGELHAIAAFIQSGGLDRAREQRIEDLKAEERRLRDLEHKLAFERGRTDPHHSVGFGSGWDASAISALIDFIGDRRGD